MAWLFDTLVSTHERRAELASARDLLRHWVQVEPWSEQANLRMICVLAMLDQRVPALRRFARYRAALIADLAIEPGQAISDLAHQIRMDNLLPPRSRYGDPGLPLDNARRDEQPHGDGHQEYRAAAEQRWLHGYLEDRFSAGENAYLAKQVSMHALTATMAEILVRSGCQMHERRYVTPQGWSELHGVSAHVYPILASGIPAKTRQNSIAFRIS